jgi:hypothetical protein
MKINKKVDSFGTIEYRNEKNYLHREDGPARELSTGEKQWFINDKLHRLDGPAVEGSLGYKYWYINGKYLTEEEFKRVTTRLGKALYL